jgi:hypothetical protein
MAVRVAINGFGRIGLQIKKSHCIPPWPASRPGQQPWPMSSGNWLTWG